MKKILFFILISSALYGQQRDKVSLRLDSLLNHTVVIGGDVFSADQCGDLYILHAESCKLAVFTGSKEDVLSLLWWIEQYPSEDLNNSWFDYQELIKEKIWE